ncbi:complement C1q-like protein 2 [Menidia menidia]
MASCWFLVLLAAGLVQAQNGGLPARVEELEKESQARVKARVAFSAAFRETSTWTTLGPEEQDLTLYFKKVLTNLGNAYNPETGVFTAPAKGLYFFTLTGVAGPTGELNAGVKRNSDLMFAIYQKAGTQASASNSMLLELEQGDRVFAQLWAGKSIADQGRLSTFSGYLVYPM